MAALDTYMRVLSSMALTVASGGGAQSSVATALSSQTYAIELSHNNSTGGMRFNVGSTLVAVNSVSSPYLPPLWVSRYKVTPGQVVAAIGDGATTGTLTIVELTK